MSKTQVTVMEVKIDEIIIYSMWSLRMSKTQVTVMEVRIYEIITFFVFILYVH